MERTDTTLLNLNSRIKSSRQTARRSTTRYSSSLAPGTETTLVLDLAFIPHDELDTPVYAWAFVEADGVQITLPLAVGASVNTIIG